MPVALFLALLWAFCIGWGTYEHSKTIRTHAQYLQQLNSAMAEQANGLLKLSEMALVASGQWLEERPDGGVVNTPRFTAAAASLREMSNGLLDLAVVDRDGNAQSIPASKYLTPANVADRDYYKAQREGLRDGLFIGASIVARKIDQWAIPLTLISGPRPHSAFPIVIINVSRLAELHDRQRMKPNGSVTMVREDGRVLSLAPFDESKLQTPTAAQTDFRTLWQPQTHGFYVDDTQSLVSFVRLTDYPVFIGLKDPMADVLAPWSQRVRVVLAITALMSVLALILAVFLLRTLNRSDASRQRFADMADIASDLVWEIDPDRRFTFISSRSKQVLGAEAQDVIGRRAEDFGWQPRSPHDATGFLRALVNRQPFSAIQFCRSPEGETGQVVSVSGRPFFDEAGTYCGYRGATSDITDRIRREEERKVQAERQMQGSKMEALGQLAGGIAHDFNNLLGAILGFAQFLVQDSPDGSRQRRYAERVVTAGLRGRSLVQQILTFSRHAPGTPVDMPMAGLIRETCDLLAATIPSTTTLSTLIEADDLAVTADRGQLGQVLLNLCLNASDALEESPGNVTIRLHATDMTRPVLRHLPICAVKPTPMLISTWHDSGGFDWIGTGGLCSSESVSITISDTGSGIAPCHLKTLLDPFFTTKDKGGGTGLGLTVVHRIITDHGGALLVRTRQGHGSTFEVILPRAHLDSIAGTLDMEAAPVPSSRSAATILVVDDDLDFCSMMEAVLQRLGYEVAAITDPVQGLAAIEEEPGLWDMLVTDQSMPRMKGSVLIQRAKAIKPDLCCILCTGYSTSLGKTEALAVGADAFCTKPVDIHEFGALVASVLRQPRTVSALLQEL